MKYFCRRKGYEKNSYKRAFHKFSYHLIHSLTFFYLTHVVNPILVKVITINQETQHNVELDFQVTPDFVEKNKKPYDQRNCYC